MSILPLTVPPKKLAQTISSSAMSFKLNNIQGWGGVDLTPSDFGTEAYGVFINSTRSQIEVFKFDPATIADASITILARGLGYSGGDVEVEANKYAWTSNDTIVQLGTDAPQLFRDFMSETNVATVTAQHTYDTLPESSVDPTDDDDFVRKAYVDGLTQPQIAVEVNQTSHGLVVGDVIRVSGVNQFAKAQADSAPNAEVVGIVTEVTDVDNFKYVTEGIITTGVPVFAAGTTLFLSRTVAGELTDTDTTTIGEVSLPLATINESGVRMTFHKYRGALINSISGNPVASETVAGSVEMATDTEFGNGDDTGGTGAPLVAKPSQIQDALDAIIASLVTPQTVEITAAGTTVVENGLTADKIDQVMIDLTDLTTGTVELKVDDIVVDEVDAGSTLNRVVLATSDIDLVAKRQYTFNMDHVTYDSINTANLPQDSDIRGAVFGDDGNKIFMVGDNTNAVYQYNLVTPYVITGYTYSGNSLSLNSQTLPGSIKFKPDGTKLFVAGQGPSEVEEYALSTPWDLSTATYTTAYGVGAQEGTTTGLEFSQDGTKMYIVGTTNDTIYQYTLGTAWDVSSASYASKSFLVSGQTGVPGSLYFKADGITLLLADRTNDDVIEYTLGTAWDISTAVYSTREYNTTAVDSKLNCADFSPDGTVMLTTGNNANRLSQFSVGEDWDGTGLAFISKA